MDSVLNIWPADPLHNPHMVWCHMCNKNFSVKTKGWSKFLGTIEPKNTSEGTSVGDTSISGAFTPSQEKSNIGLEGRSSVKLNWREELPKFIHTELVDVEERFSFYEDYLKGSTTALVTPQSRAKTQICLIGDFIQRQGDLTVHRILWSRVGSFTDYQAAFHDFEWSGERLTVIRMSCFRFLLTR